MSTLEYKLETNKTELSEHAYEQMRERFPNEARNKQSALNYVRSILKSSKYMGVLPDNYGVEAHFYVYNAKIAIHIALDSYMIKTVYTLEKQKPIVSFRSKIESIYHTEYRKLGRAEIALKRKLKLVVAECESEVAQLKLRRLKTRSENVKKDCDVKIAEWNNKKWSVNKDLENVQRARKDIAFIIATENY